MAISGVGKIADQGLLARTLSQLNTLSKTTETPAVKQTAQTPQVTEGASRTQTAAAMTRQAAATARAADNERIGAPKAENQVAEAPQAGLDIKA